ncbi:MAG: aminopeptidase [Planctomycetota bacterium]|nr:aminopeptidase [Planctomycetota bacterium]
MRDPRLDQLARVLVEYSTRVKPGDIVALNVEANAFPLLEALFESVLRAGGHPMWTPRSERLRQIMVQHASEEQLRFTQPVLLHASQTVDVRISILSEVNTRAFGKQDPARVAMLQQARRPLMKTEMARCAAGAMRWCGALYPTEAYAQDAEMSLDQFAAFAFAACMLDKPDPVASWRELQAQQQRACDHLAKCSSLRFSTPPSDADDGTDLHIDVSPASGARWINCAGEENMPDGEIFSGPQGADGHVNFTAPANFMGSTVEGIRLQFKHGRVVDAVAKRNEDFLIKLLDQDPGARTMGEIAIGTNPGLADYSGNTLFDEKILGTFHLAVGAGIPESGNTNDSALHWDIVSELRPVRSTTGRVVRPGGIIIADGVVIQRDGVFTQPGWPARA